MNKCNHLHGSLLTSSGLSRGAVTHGRRAISHSNKCYRATGELWSVAILTTNTLGGLRRDRAMQRSMAQRQHHRYIHFFFDLADSIRTSNRNGPARSCFANMLPPAPADADSGDGDGGGASDEAAAASAVTQIHTWNYYHRINSGTLDEHEFFLLFATPGQQRRVGHDGCKRQIHESPTHCRAS